MQVGVFYYIGGGGRCGLARVHACALACGLPGRTGGFGESTCTPDSTVYNPGITAHISRAGHGMVPPAFESSSSGSLMGVPIGQIMHPASMRCEIAGSAGAGRVVQLRIAPTTSRRAPARHRRDNGLRAVSVFAHTTHHASIGRASSAPSQPVVLAMLFQETTRT